MPKLEKRMVEPTIGMRDLATILNVSIRNIKKYYLDIIQRNVRYNNTSYGKKFLLADVMKLAYPDADNQTIHYLAYIHTMRLSKIRCRLKQKIKEKEIQLEEVEDA